MDKYKKRRIVFDDRVGRQLAKEAIRGNVLRSLVEPITNCDDSYARLESQGHDIVDGEITIAYLKKRKAHSEIGIRDFAEGMNEDKMISRIGKYGGDTSGFSNDMNVRGTFGRGLKDAVLSIGEGKIISIVDDVMYSCSLTPPWEFQLKRPKKVTPIDRKETGISKNGTVVYIKVTEKDVSIPQYDTLRTNLPKLVFLRDIMRDPKRKVVLVRKDSRGKEKREILNYPTPIGEEIYIKKDLPIPGYSGATFNIVVKRANVPLTQKDYTRDGGLLIKSGRTIHEATLFKYDEDENAERLFGEVRCDYLDKLLKEGKPVISGKRDRLEWDYVFNKALKKEIEKILGTIVEEERKKNEGIKKRIESEKTRQRFKHAIKELNKIAKLELESNELTGPEPGDEERERPMPEGGLEFIPDYYQVVSGQHSTLSLKASVPDFLANNTEVTIESDNPDIKILTPSIILDEEKGIEGILTTQVRIEGTRVGAQGLVTAKVDGFETKADIIVISHRTKKPSEERKKDKKKRGLFTGIEYSDIEDPRNRARYDRITGRIIIALKEASVEKYHKKGTDDPQCQVLVAELVLDVVCTELARRKEPWAPTDAGKLAAIQTEYRNLKYKYANMLHDILGPK